MSRSSDLSQIGQGHCGGQPLEEIARRFGIDPACLLSIEEMEAILLQGGQAQNSKNETTDGEVASAGSFTAQILTHLGIPLWDDDEDAEAVVREAILEQGFRAHFQHGR